MAAYCSWEGFKYYIKSPINMGAYIDMHNFGQGLLKYGRYDEYHTYFSPAFLAELTQDEAIRAYFSQAKLKVASLQALLTAPPVDCHVIHFETMCAFEEHTFRNHIGPHNVPVTRRVYTIATAGHLREFLMYYLLSQGGRPYDSIVVPSQATKDVLWAYFADVADQVGFPHRGRIDVIPYGIEAAEFQPVAQSEARDRLDLPQDAVILLSIGRLSSRSKLRYDRLLTLFQTIVRHTQTPVLLVLAGASRHEELAELTALVAALDLVGKVRLLPNFDASQKASLYSACDIFVSLSDNLQESFGIALIEALMSGLPVVCSDWNGYKDLIENDVNGVRIPTTWTVTDTAQDQITGLLHPFSHQRIFAISQQIEIDPDVFIARTLELIQNKPLRKRFGQTAREMALQKYALPTVIAAFEDLWQELHDRAEHDTTNYANLGRLLTYDYPRHFQGYPTRFD